MLPRPERADAFMVNRGSMPRISKEVRELYHEIHRLPPKMKRDLYLRYFAHVVSFATHNQIIRIRALCADGRMRLTVGPKCQQRILEVIDGHLALREMGLVRRQSAVAG